MIKGIVRGQQLTIEHPLIVSGTIDYLTATFNFITSDWFGLAKWAHFTQGDIVYDIKLGADRIEKNQHLNLADGEWKVYLHGNEYKDGEIIERITTNTATLNVVKSGTLNGEPFPKIPASVAEQIFAEIEQLKKDVAGGDIPIEVIKEAVNKYLEENPIEFEETDPTIYDWAKKPAKPEYTAEEVGAEPIVEFVEVTGNDFLFETGNKYIATIDKDCKIRAKMPLNFDVDNTILVYARFASAVSVDWGSDVLFYGDTIPEIKEGYCDIIFTFEPTAQKWCIGVISKGAVE